MSSENLFDAIRLELKRNPWHQGSFSLYNFTDMPRDCPWFEFKDFDTSKVITSIFNPISDKVPQTIGTLLQNCVSHLLLLENDHWFLVYALKGQGKTEYRFFCGGPANNTPEMSPKNRDFGWRIPAPLRLFYQSHNGFGPLEPLGMFWNYRAVLPDYRLETLDDLFRRIGNPQAPYNPDDLLVFFMDGLGNGTYFYRTSRKPLEFSIVNWDHETRKIGNLQSFWDFVDQELSDLIADG